MSRPSIAALEFSALLTLLRGYTTCAPGRRHIEALSPGENRDALASSFALIAESIAYLRSGQELGFGSLADPDDWLPLLDSPAAVLAPLQLLDAASLADTAAGVRASFREDKAKFPRLAELAASLADLRSLSTAIRRAVLPNGEISDDASPQLKKIRASLARSREQIQKTLERILRARGAEPGQDYVTLRNDRFVIPVPAADRRAVPGVVHGSSATGQTVFLEPLEALDLNNQLVQLAEDETAEIARILTELTERLRTERNPLRHSARHIALLDSLLARARFAREYDACIPRFSDGNFLRLDAARHPVLEANLRRTGRAIVPMSLSMGGEESILVISGPNTGGKTVALKTVGLAALAAQSAIPVAAQAAELPLFDLVLVDIGDEQSIAADLSTFSAHMLNLRAMLEEATPRSLVLVDEIGTGTAPEEGSALAVALLEEFLARRSLTIATTHHDRVKAWASTTPGVLNAAVEFDTVNLRPTYRLLVGVPGVSSGIDIARRLELPARIIDRAREQLAPETREAAGLIAYLHRTRDEIDALQKQSAAQLASLEEERRKLQTEWAERQRRRLAELEQQFSLVIKQYQDEISALVGEIKDRNVRSQIEKQSLRRTRKLAAEAREETDAAVAAHLSDSQADLGPAAGTLAAEISVPPSPEQLVPGARVRVKGLATTVILRHLDARSAEVQAGPLRMRVPVTDILSVVSDATAPRSAHAVAPASAPPSSSAANPKRSSPAEANRGVTLTRDPLAPVSNAPPAQSQKVRGHAGQASSRNRAANAPAPATDEINVIGLTVEEASALVDKFLDNAALDSKPSIRIIHGHGTGALRRGLAKFLAAHPLVASLREEDPQHGGAAITVVQLHR